MHVHMCVAGGCANRNPTSVYTFIGHVCQLESSVKEMAINRRIKLCIKNVCYEKMWNNRLA